MQKKSTALYSKQTRAYIPKQRSEPVVAACPLLFVALHVYIPESSGYA